jgi:D-beta-D-heptose 7-phosphate kinase/D-beta-D-heptose 1-phosphate adenosyltransferase
MVEARLIQVIRGAEAEREEDRLGGAANVARNLSHLGVSVFCAGVVGTDQDGKIVRALVKDGGIGDGVVADSKRRTSVKTRMIAHGQQVLRVDAEVTDPVASVVEKRLLAKITGRKKQDAIVISDYRKGAITPKLIQGIVKHARKKGIPVLAGPKGHDLSRYAGVTLLSLNRKELGDVAGRPLASEGDIRKAGEALRKSIKAEYVLVTLGADGMLLIGGKKPFQVHATARSVYDVTGAGDTALGTLSFLTAAGADLQDAVSLANIASGIVVGKVGTATVTRDEIVRHLSSDHLLGDAKILKRGPLGKVVRRLQAEEKRVVFTNGCFDLLHGGHLQTLQFAKNQGDVLVIGLNSDRSVRGLKGAGRPIQDEQARARMLAALEIVDYVTIFGEPTPEKLIRSLKPDVLVKGADWKGKKVAGSNAVGRVAFAPLVPGKSTTSLVDRIQGELS